MRALITGPFGQTGSYLAEALTRAGDEVCGLVHRHGDDRQAWLSTLAPGIDYVEGDLTDHGALRRALDEARPDVIFHLGAISAPAAGWTSPTTMAEVTALGTLRLLEAASYWLARDAVVVTAGSIATHGPYGAAKAFSRAIAADSRQRGMRVSTAVFGGHHSPRRSPVFFSRKVTRAAARIRVALDRGDTPGKLNLGPLDRSQDWGAAPDFVQALMEIAGAAPGDYVVSTGLPYTNAHWVATVFEAVDLPWREWVTYDSSLGQPTDVPALTAKPSDKLIWRPSVGFDELVSWMVNADLDAERGRFPAGDDLR